MKQINQEKTPNLFNYIKIRIHSYHPGLAVLNNNWQIIMKT